MAKQPISSFNNLQLSGLEELVPSSGHEQKSPVEGRGGRVSKKVAAPANADLILAGGRKRAEEALARTRQSIEARVLQQTFPGWDDDNRGVPNPFIRSGLFSVKNNKEEDREYLDKLILPSLSNYSIEYTGKELAQDDLSCWMFLINLAKNQAISDSVFFTGYQLCKDLGWSVNSKSYERARNSIARLKVTGLEIGEKSPNTGEKLRAYAGSLIREYSWDSIDMEGNKRWMVRFEPSISMLFMHDTTTLTSWDIRRTIGARHTVAQWLHMYFDSHEKPMPITVRKLHELGRSGDSISSYRNTLRRALEKLVEVQFLTSFTITKDLVEVVRNLQPKLHTSKDRASKKQVGTSTAKGSLPG